MASISGELPEEKELMVSSNSPSKMSPPQLNC